MSVYAEHGVRNVWLIHPILTTLEAYKPSSLNSATACNNDLVRELSDAIPARKGMITKLQHHVQAFGEEEMK